MRHLLFALLVAVLCANPAMAERTRVGIAAVVNDDIVTFADVSNRIGLYASGQPLKGDARKKMEQQVLSRLIDEKLQLQEAKSLNIVVDEQAVNEGFADVARQNGSTADEFRTRLEKGGVRPATLYDQLRAEIAWSQVVRRKLRPQINVSESEIDSEMQKISSTAGKPSFRVAEIFLPVADSNGDAKAKGEAEKIVKQLLGGAPFAQMARDYSQSPGAGAGGDIGWIDEGQLEETLDRALAKMQPGQVSPPVRGQKGYYILFLREKREGASAESTQKPAAAAAPRATTILHLKQLTIEISATDPMPIVNAKVVRAQSLKDEVKSCADMEGQLTSFSKASGDMGDVPVDRLPAPVRQAVENLEAGVLSAPARTPEGIAVYMVCARKQQDLPQIAASQEATPAIDLPAPAPSEEQKREKLANKIGLQRLTQMQERYLRDLRASAFIDKRL